MLFSGVSRRVAYAINAGEPGIELQAPASRDVILLRGTDPSVEAEATAEPCVIKWDQPQWSQGSDVTELALRFRGGDEATVTIYLREACQAIFVPVGYRILASWSVEAIPASRV